VVVHFLKSATQKGEYPKLRLPKIAFLGRSNVGKSSLWIFVDLPGYGYAKAPKNVRVRWGNMVEEFLREDENLKLTVMMVDARREPTDLDLVMQEWLDQFSIPYQVVATKVDKLSSNQLQKSLNQIENVFNCSVLPYSAATGMGKKKLWRILERI
jgi:GTP-binding protein